MIRDGDELYGDELWCPACSYREKVGVAPAAAPVPPVPLVHADSDSMSRDKERVTGQKTAPGKGGEHPERPFVARVPDEKIRAMTDPRCTLTVGVRNGVCHQVQYMGTRPITVCGLRLNVYSEVLLFLQRPERVNCPGCRGGKKPA